MTWFKLDDQFHSQPKVIAAGNAAIGLYCRLGTYCADKLTDGFVATAIAKSMGTSRELRALLECPIPDTRPLLTEVDAGYLIRDYLEYNPTREKVIADREAAKQRMNKLRGSPDVRPNTSPNEHPNTERSSVSPETRPPTTTSTQETDDLQTVAESSSVDIALKIAARATHLANPAACKASNPQRYIDGIERTMRLERIIQATELAGYGMDPVDIAAALTQSPTHAFAAAIELGIPVPEPAPPRQPCTTCDNSGWITDDPEYRIVIECPDCNLAHEAAS